MDWLLATQLLGSVVLRGDDGVRASNHEQPHSLAATPNLFGQDPWLVDQHRAQVVEVLSPGSYVPGGSQAIS